MSKQQTQAATPLNVQPSLLWLARGESIARGTYNRAGLKKTASFRWRILGLPAPKQPRVAYHLGVLAEMDERPPNPEFAHQSFLSGDFAKIVTGVPIAVLAKNFWAM